MRKTDENQLIWESYNQSGVITSMKVDGDMIQLKGMSFAEHIDNISVNIKASTARIENGDYKISPRILKALMAMGVPNQDFDAEYEDFRSGKANLRNLEKDLETRPHDADDSDLDDLD